MEREFIIIDGPSKWDLFVSLDKVDKFQVRFLISSKDVKKKYKQPVYLFITMLERVGGPREKWNFKACTLSFGGHSWCDRVRIKGFFDTKIRKGTMEILKN